MPSLYGRIKSRRTTPLFDEVTIDIVERSSLPEKDRIVYLVDHKVRVPRFASDGEVLAILAAEMTRFELQAIPDSEESESTSLNNNLKAARPDRGMGAQMVAALREAGRIP